MTFFKTIPIFYKAIKPIMTFFLEIILELH